MTRIHAQPAGISAGPGPGTGPGPGPGRALFASHALLPEGFRDNVRFELAADGTLAAVTPGGSPEGAERLAGPVLPGVVDAHSHAFQRAMAGLTETAGATPDSFWTWRQVMYRFLDSLTPDDVEAIATQLYIELLRAGYTTVVEFHYLHHDPSGAPYLDPAELSRRILRAARRAGIGLTLLPVLYAHSDFGGAPPLGPQRRFLLDPERLLTLFDTLRAAVAGDGLVRIGAAPHSLRAVTPDELEWVHAEIRRRDPRAPLHLHIAEQTAEVEGCLRVHGARPVEWLLKNLPVDSATCLVHATHLSDEETELLARSGAVAGLCPTTEANLGDGLFPAPRYLAAGGLFCIGSDSHVSVDPFEELRLLELGQRLVHRRRNVLSAGPGCSTGGTLFRAALAGGALASGQPTSALRPGARADLLVLDAELPSLCGRRGDGLLDAAIFGPRDRSPVRDVIIGGQFVIRGRRHAEEEAAATAYRQTVHRLLG